MWPGLWRFPLDIIMQACKRKHSIVCRQDNLSSSWTFCILFRPSMPTLTNLDAASAEYSSKASTLHSPEVTL